MAHGDITHIDIPVSDTARATQFCGTLFGWQMVAMPKQAIDETSWFAAIRDLDRNEIGL